MQPSKKYTPKNKGECLVINARQKIGFINNSFFWCQFRITATLTDSPLRNKDISIKTSNFPWPNMMSLLWLSFITTSCSCLISLTTFNFQWDTNNSFRVRYLCFKIPIALLHACIWIQSALTGTTFGLKVTDSFCHFQQMISFSYKICFLFYSFLPFLLSLCLLFTPAF